MRRVLLTCGILAPLLYLATDILGGLRYPGYRFTAQAVSELGFGIIERVNIYASQLWMAVLAVALLRRPRYVEEP